MTDYLAFRDQAIEQLKQEYPGCMGYPDCDGDLGEEHIPECPLYGKPDRDWSMMLVDERAKYLAAIDCLRKLVAKLTAIEQDPGFTSVFTIAMVHRCPYNGPNWADEIGESRRMLGV